MSFSDLLSREKRSSIKNSLQREKRQGLSPRIRFAAKKSSFRLSRNNQREHNKQITNNDLDIFETSTITNKDLDMFDYTSGRPKVTVSPSVRIAAKSSQQRLSMRLQQRTQKEEDSDDDSDSDSDDSSDSSSYESVSDDDKQGPSLKEKLAARMGLNIDEEERLSDLIHGKKAKYFRPASADADTWTLGYLRRYKGKHVTAFHFHTSEGKFVLAASMMNDAKGEILFTTVTNTMKIKSLERIPRDPKERLYLGCMYHHKGGLEYTLYDYRVANPKLMDKRQIHDLAYIEYRTNMRGSRPNEMWVVVPAFSEEVALTAQFETIKERFKRMTVKKVIYGGDPSLKKRNAKKNMEPRNSYGQLDTAENQQLVRLKTKAPVWMESIQGWSLNFHGRAKMASKKNFILEQDTTDNAYGGELMRVEDEIIRFGKLKNSKDKTTTIFSLDYKHPVAPIQAVAIAMTTFCKKKLAA